MKPIKRSAGLRRSIDQAILDHRAIRAGTHDDDDSPERDAIDDELSDIWWDMPEIERAVLRETCADLYAITDAPETLQCLAVKWRGLGYSAVAEEIESHIAFGQDLNRETP